MSEESKELSTSVISEEVIPEGTKTVVNVNVNQNVKNIPFAKNSFIEKPGQGQALASMVLGILSLLFLISGIGSIVSIILAIIGVVLGSSAKSKLADNERTMANTGIICSIISLAIVAVFVLVMVLALFSL